YMQYIRLIIPPSAPPLLVAPIPPPLEDAYEWSLPIFTTVTLPLAVWAVVVVVVVDILVGLVLRLRVKVLVFECCPAAASCKAFCLALLAFWRVCSI
ncbi:hypothetical protein DOY81_002618, partial [Sarcophaga bullata]